VVVLPFKSKVEALGASTLFIGCALLVTGLLLFASDRLRPGRKNERTMTVTDALLIGCAQALAVVPGLSRSGTTISAGTARGLDRTFAVRFSFLMSLPAVLGATLLEVIDAAKTGVDPALIPQYILGMAVAAVSGYFAIRLVNLLAKKGRFGAFAYYCWAVGIVTIIATFVLK
jgi:undecaprenyl-diphosphatase